MAPWLPGPGIFIEHRSSASGGGGGSWIEDAVSGTRDSARAAVEDVRIDHRGAHVVVAQQLLNRADVVPIFEEIGGEGVAQAVRGGSLGKARSADGLDMTARCRTVSCR